MFCLDWVKDSVKTTIIERNRHQALNRAKKVLMIIQMEAFQISTFMRKILEWIVQKKKI